MKITDINLRKIGTTDLRKQLLRGLFEKPSRKEFDSVLDKVITAFEGRDYRSSLHGLMVMVYHDSDRTFQNIRRKGFFRYYNYVGGKCFLPDLVKEFKTSCEAFNLLTPSLATYFDSVSTMASFHDYYSALNTQILQYITDFKRKFPDRSFVKTMLAFADFLFLGRYKVENGENDTIEEEKMVLKERNIEGVCAGISYLIWYYTARFHPFPLPAAEDYIVTGEIDYLLLHTCTFLDLREYEILVEHFGYQCRFVNDSYVIDSPNQDIEKVIRLGYIRSDIQSINDLVVNEIPDVLSMHDLAKGLFEAGFNKFIEKADDSGYCRYRIKFTDLFITTINEQFISKDELFQEEIVYLSTAIKEQLLTKEELSKIAFQGSLSLFDFLKGRRWFLVVALLYEKVLTMENKEDFKTVCRTLVTQLTKEAIHELLKQFFTPEQTDAFLEILSWGPGQPQKYDLQYQPFVLFDKHYEIPLFVFSYSNAIRNLYASQYKQANTSLMSDGKTDALVSELSSLFQKKGMITGTGISFKNTDIDVCCLFGDTLFVFECKHTLHPVDVFDLRTMYNHIQSAERQLHIIETGFQDGSLIPVLSKHLGPTVENAIKICPSIIVSNRLFNGDVFKYPIRYIKEVTNVIAKGEITTPQALYRLWPEPRLTPAYMEEYFGKDNPLSKMHMECLIPKVRKQEVLHPHVEFHTYSLLMEHANTVVDRYIKKLHKVADL